MYENRHISAVGGMCLFSFFVRALADRPGQFRAAAVRRKL